MNRVAAGQLGRGAVGFAIAVIASLAIAAHAAATDHGDAPAAAYDQPADIGDLFFFLDPNDNNRAVLAMDVRGFVVPSMNRYLGNFDPGVRLHFAINSKGRPAEDRAIYVTFGGRTAFTIPQSARIRVVKFRKKRRGKRIRPKTVASFSAPVTLSSSTALVPPAPVITTHPGSGIAFFAGLRDDPSFADIPALIAYLAARFGGAPDPGTLDRERDSFAGYNTSMVALEVPKGLLNAKRNPPLVGLAGITERRARTVRSTRRAAVDRGPWVAIDRVGYPAVNPFLVGSRPSGAPGCAGAPANPLAQNDRFNRVPPHRAGRFSPEIVRNLACLRTEADDLAALTRTITGCGDYLWLDLSKPNAGLGPGGNGFGTSTAFCGAAKPNGRRPADDVIDTIVTLIANLDPTSDGVDSNEVPLLPTFPFFAPPAQPFTSGVDDRTRN